MKFQKFITEKSEQLAIPTNRLDFNEYRDTQQQGDVIQVYFRDNNPPKEKYGFEYVDKDGSSIPDSIIKDQLSRMLKEMERSYLDSSGRVTFYDGQAFFWRELTNANGRDEDVQVPQVSFTPEKQCLQLECTSCGQQIKSQYIETETFNEYRDVLLMWLLARAKGRCGCSKFDAVSQRNENLADIPIDAGDIQIPEGSAFPRP